MAVQQAEVSKKELEYRRRLRDDFKFYAPKALKISAKKGELVPFELNKAQLYLHAIAEKQLLEKGRVRIIVLKGRQQGISTYIEGRFYWRTSHKKSKKAFILTHEDKATSTLFDMAQRYHDNCLPQVKPITGAQSAKALNFSQLDSGYAVGTAGSKAVGRGSVTQYFHGCLAEGTQIVDGETNSLVNIEDCEVGDLVITNTGEIAPISFISTQEKQCLEVVFKGLVWCPLVATPEHRFWTKEGWKELGDLVDGDTIGFPLLKLTNEKQILAPDIQEPNRPQGGGAWERMPETINADYDLGRVLGLYLAEGSIALQHKAPHKPSSVTFTVHRKEAERTKAWLRFLEATYTSLHQNNRKNSLTTTITVYGGAFAQFINQVCGRKDNKRLPEITNREFGRGILHGYLSGDGHSSPVRDRRIQAPSIRSSITIGMRTLAASLGYGWASVGHRDAGIRNGRNEKEQHTFRLTGKGVDILAPELGFEMPERKRHGNYGETEVSSGYAWVQIKNIEEVGLKTVYDFEVDHEDHSYCTVHGAAKNSEVAFWPHAETHAMGVMQGVALVDGTEVFLESTANGIGNYFHTQWQLAERGESDYIAVFLPWYWQDEYTLPCDDDFDLTQEEFELLKLFKKDGLTAEHLNWRRMKTGELSTGGEDGEWRFKQEYPFTAAEAFQTSGEESLIDPKVVLAARKAEKAMAGAHIVGVDPARFGKDRTAIIHRNGRKAYGSIAYRKKSTMEVAGYCVRILTDEISGEPTDVDMMFIDVGGLGAGVYDRLVELGYEEDGRIMAVNSANRPLDDIRFSNKRAEMAVGMREWFELPGGVDIEDLDVLQADLCGPRYKYDSAGRIVLEKKEDMKKRGLESPDFFDALALTFAEPVAPPNLKKRRAQANIKTVKYHV